ncbi:Crp/Fnr family transcriptional regulator [Thioclava sp. SK-1]|uniref:Crp/Fnr family transcriptional regulator n=1 Tax=Thioclava sp. SK-1 TaxID=1889770 RepID=UPI0008263351|nr:Crp/Fnr family transcriptional regulator [Thioclava sp. SK-1]OCX64528.1 Crp/Fnr family transcriptional regulator [Thioclava sp. SK-1]
MSRSEHPAQRISCTECPLRAMDCFLPFSDNELAFMEQFKTGELIVDAGTTVLLEGASSPQLFTIFDGMGLRYKTLPDGARQVLNFAFPGDFLGLQAALMGELSHGFEASTRMRLCVFDRSAMWDLLREQPRRAFALTWLAAREEHLMAESLTSVGQRPAEARIAWGLLQVFARMNELGEVKDHRTVMPWRQQDLADALGMSLVHTNKTLAKLRAQGLADWRRGTLYVPDAAKLADFAEIEHIKPERRPLI